MRGTWFLRQAALRRWPAAVAALGVVSLAVMLTTGERGNQAAAQETKPDLPPDLARVQSASFLIGSVNVDAILNSNATKGIREKALQALSEPLKGLESEIGIGILDINRITMVLQGIGHDQSEPVFVVAVKKTIEPENVLRAALPQYTEKTVENAKVYVGTPPHRKSISFLDGKSYIIGEGDIVERFLSTPPPPKKAGPLTPVLQAIASGKHAAVFGVNPDLLAALEDKLPPQVDPFKPLLAAKSSLVTVDLTDKLTVEARGTFADAKDAEKAATVVEELRKMVLGFMAEGIERTEKQGKDWAKIVELMKLGETAVKEGTVKQKDAEVHIALSAKTDMATLNGALIEAVGKIRDSAGRIQSQNNLKQIALSFHNYMDTTGAFPTNVVDKNGKPMLSWRVMILPYIEQDNLFKQFHLDEPWDSEHNKKLIDQMPTTYLMPGDDAKKHLTRYQGFNGKGALFDGAVGKKITDITDGTSNTIMVVEGAKGVIWTKPDDLPFGDDKLVPLVANPKKGGFNAAICDGSVRFFKNSIKEDTLRALITISGGEVIPADADD
jgi:hypothetical protein